MRSLSCLFACGGVQWGAHAAFHTRAGCRRVCCGILASASASWRPCCRRCLPCTFPCCTKGDATTTHLVVFLTTVHVSCIATVSSPWPPVCGLVLALGMCNNIATLPSIAHTHVAHTHNHVALVTTSHTVWRHGACSVGGVHTCTRPAACLGTHLCNGRRDGRWRLHAAPDRSACTSRCLPHSPLCRQLAHSCNVHLTP